MKRYRDRDNQQYAAGKLKEEKLPEGPFIPMFLNFRNELDEHHDRRERVIKASRDITALSKKMIFSLQRLKDPETQKVPPEVDKYEADIQTLIRTVAADLQGLSSFRYQRQISPGIQEYIEALSFRHYLLHSKLITLEEVQSFLKPSSPPQPPTQSESENTAKRVKAEVDVQDIQTGLQQETLADAGDAENPAQQSILLTSGDYVLGIFDLVGEIMRFAITKIATSHGSTSSFPVLEHLRDMRLAFEGLDTSGAMGGMAKEVDKKLEVMKTCVNKVEMAMYGMVVRGRERPEGWVMEVKEERFDDE